MLLSQKIEKIADRIQESVCKKYSNENVFYADKGVEHFWPDISGWEPVDWDYVDKFGSSEGISYQYYNTGVIVSFDGRKIASGKGKGTWEFTDYGETYKGMFNSEKDVSSILAKIAKDDKKRLEDAKKRVPKFAGWELGVTQDAIYTKQLSTDFLISIVFWDFFDTAYDNNEVGRVSLSFDDNGGYRTRNIIDKSTSYKNINDVKKIIFQFEKECKNKIKNY